jgi:hypothetical protein
VEIDAPEDFDYLEYVTDRYPHPLIEKLGSAKESVDQT